MQPEICLGSAADLLKIESAVGISLTEANSGQQLLSIELPCRQPPIDVIHDRVGFEMGERTSNAPADLVAAERQRDSVRSAFRGQEARRSNFSGKSLSTFASANSL